LLVTHNVEEAIGLADRLLLLSIGPARILADVAVAAARGAHAGGARSSPRRDRAAAQSGVFRVNPLRAVAAVLPKSLLYPRQRNDLTLWLPVCPSGHIANSFDKTI
jgi:hypothetical protein